MHRKLSAILMADVVGYSRLMEREEATTHIALKALQKDLIEPGIRSHHGQIIRVMGDGTLVDFQSAVDAVACAAEIQRAMAESQRTVPEDRRIVLRIGINLGDIIVEDDDIYGDGVNIAARLEALAPPGGILISEPVYSQVYRPLPLRYEHLGEIRVKNISRPISAYTVLLDPSHEAWAIDQPSEEEQPSDSLPLPDRPGIAVLPFINLSDDPARQYFIDGFVDDLITDLSRFQTLSVIARTSSFAFPGDGHSLKTISRELGVQYVLEGSLREFGKRVRIIVQLVDCESGEHLWADRYDRLLDDLFEVQDDVISRIVGALESRLVQDRLETAKRSAPRNLKAYDYWLQGNKLMENWTAETDDEAIPLFEKAIRLDPNFARAHASLAGIYNARKLLAPGSPTDAEDRARGLGCAKTSVSLDPADARNHVNLAWAYMRVRDFLRAERQFDLAGRLNPNDPNILITRAVAIAYLGDSGEGLRLAAKAILLNPLHPDFYFGNLAAIHFLAGKYEESIEMIKEAPTVWPLIWAWCAAGYGQLGRAPEAQGAAEKFVADVSRQWIGTSDATVNDYVDWFFEVNPIRRREDVGRIVDGLRNAGLPEPGEAAAG